MHSLFDETGAIIAQTVMGVHSLKAIFSFTFFLFIIKKRTIVIHFVIP